MKEESVFERLVDRLSSSERKDLLEKIRSSRDMDEESFTEEPIEIEEDGDVDVEEKYSQSNFFIKLLLFVKSLLTGRDLYKLVEERLLKEIMRNIEKIYPSLIDFRRRDFLRPMHEELCKLRDAMSVFHNPLRKAIGEKKMDFFAFLGGMEMEFIQENLIIDTDPYSETDTFLGKSDQELKEELERRLEEDLSSISETERDRMYKHAKSLYSLNELSFFPFAKIISGFVKDSTGAPEFCPVREVEASFLHLVDILSGFKQYPGAKLLHALFIFHLREDLEDDDFDLEEKLTRLYSDAQGAISQIRYWKRAVPFCQIAKYITGKINYHPEDRAGGEDWFALYIQFWKIRLERRFRTFSADRKKRELINEILSFIKLGKLPSMEYYCTGSRNDSDIQPRHEMSLGFLLGFLEQVFLPGMNKTLKLLLIDGDFYKDINREEFTDAYNNIYNISDQIKRIEFNISPAGEAGKAIENVRKELITPSLKRRKIQGIVRGVDSEAKKVIINAIENLKILENVLHGILYGEVGGRYDTISNLGYIGGRENKRVIEDFKRVLSKTIQTGEYLRSIYDLEISYDQIQLD